MLTGWLCLRCGKMYAPFVRECNCQPPTEAANSSTHEFIMPDKTEIADSLGWVVHSVGPCDPAVTWETTIWPILKREEKV